MKFSCLTYMKEPDLDEFKANAVSSSIMDVRRVIIISYHSTETRLSIW